MPLIDTLNIMYTNGTSRNCTEGVNTDLTARGLSICCSLFAI